MEKPPPSGPVTTLLRAWSAGDRAALDALMPLVYGDLLRIAQAHLRRERPGHTLERTGLVHEAFERLLEQRRVAWEGRAHFLGLASQVMRRILVDHARARHADKRGGGAAVLSLDDTLERAAAEGGAAQGLASGANDPVDILAIDRALTQLEALDAQQGHIVELRFFGGLTVEETAEALAISPATVKRDWAMARAWLQLQLAEPAP